MNSCVCPLEQNLSVHVADSNLLRLKLWRCVVAGFTGIDDPYEPPLNCEVCNVPLLRGFFYRNKLYEVFWYTPRVFFQNECFTLLITHWLFPTDRAEFVKRNLPNTTRNGGAGNIILRRERLLTLRMISYCRVLLFAYGLTCPLNMGYNTRYCFTIDAWAPGRIQAKRLRSVLLCSISRIVCTSIEYDDSHLSCLGDRWYFWFFVSITTRKRSHTKVVKTIYYLNTFSKMTTK